MRTRPTATACILIHICPAARPLWMSSSSALPAPHHHITTAPRPPSTSTTPQRHTATQAETSTTPTTRPYHTSPAYNPTTSRARRPAYTMGACGTRPLYACLPRLARSRAPQPPGMPPDHGKEGGHLRPAHMPARRRMRSAMRRRTTRPAPPHNHSAPPTIHFHHAPMPHDAQPNTRQHNGTRHEKAMHVCAKGQLSDNGGAVQDSGWKLQTRSGAFAPELCGERKAQAELREGEREARKENPHRAPLQARRLRYTGREHRRRQSTRWKARADHSGIAVCAGRSPSSCRRRDRPSVGPSVLRQRQRRRRQAGMPVLRDGIEGNHRPESLWYAEV